MKSKTVTWMWIIFYISIAAIIFRFDERFLDLVGYIPLFAFILVVGRKIEIPPVSVWLFGAGTLLHVAGIFPFKVDGQTLSLYYLYANYDILCHLFGFLLFCVGFLYVYYANHKNPSKLDIAIVLLALVGTGSFIEVSEYLGYRLFGFGEGYLRFGEGDNSTNFGPWGDSMTDSIANVLGILIGFVSYILINYRQRSTNR